MVGGRDYTNTSTASFNLATDAGASPGLVLQDLRAVAAARGGILPQTQFGAPTGSRSTCRGGRCGRCATTGAYRGLIPLTTATHGFSDNTVFAQLALRIGTERIRAHRALMGIARPDRRRSAIALGGLRHCCTPMRWRSTTPTLGQRRG